MIGVQTLNHLGQRDVGAIFDHPEEITLMGIQPRPARIASRPRRNASGTPVLARPAAHRRLPNAQPPTNRAQRQSVLDDKPYRP